MANSYQNLGILFRKLSNPRWVAVQALQQAASIVVLNPVGKYVHAKLFGHTHHDDGRIPHYRDSEGHEYIEADGKKYLYHAASDTWYKAD
jgi:hypothetical protein